MIILTFCLKRLSHLSRAEFQAYWKNNHGPLVKRHAQILKIKRYVQLHSATEEQNLRAGTLRGAPEEYDGVAQLWWDSWEALGTIGGAKEGREALAALLEDEKKFIDHARSPLWYGEEHEIF